MTFTLSLVEGLLNTCYPIWDLFCFNRDLVTLLRILMAALMITIPSLSNWSGPSYSKVPLNSKFKITNGPTFSCGTIECSCSTSLLPMPRLLFVNITWISFHCQTRWGSSLLSHSGNHLATHGVPKSVCLLLGSLRGLKRGKLNTGSQGEKNSMLVIGAHEVYAHVGDVISSARLQIRLVSPTEMKEQIECTDWHINTF